MERRILFAVLGGLSAFLLAAAPSDAHETNFGLQPDTIFKGGWMSETEASYRLKKSLYEGSRQVTNTEGLREEEWEIHTELAYGWDEKTMVGLSLPWVRMSESRGGQRETSEGLGDVGLLFKRRLYKADFLGGSDYFSVIGEYRLATARHTDDPSLGTGNDSYRAGGGYAHVSQKWAWWADAAYGSEVAPHGDRPGDTLFWNLAAGYRPRVAELNELDVQYLLEWNAEHRGRTREDSRPLPSSGGSEFFVSPGLLLGYQNVLVKFGVQVPVYRNLNGRQLATDVHAKAIVEFTF